MAALQVRRDALKAAFTIANNKDRAVAIEAALKAYATAAATARAKFKADVKAAWAVFATATVNCRIPSDRKDSRNKNGEHDDRDDDDDNGRDKGDRKDNGLHLGWLKNVNVKSWFSGKAKMDLKN